jgi:hypothetical protein
MSEETIISKDGRQIKVDDYVVSAEVHGGVLPDIFRVVEIYENYDNDPLGTKMLVTEKGLGTDKSRVEKIPNEVRHATQHEVYSDLFSGMVKLASFVKLESESDGVQTRLSYRYRDGGNNKTGSSVLFRGKITFEELQTLFRRMDTEFAESFIPGQVGLRDLQGQFAAGWDDELDHPWHELVSVELTTGGPKGDDAEDTRSISDFVAEVAKVEWDNSYKPEGAEVTGDKDETDLAP